MIQYSSTLPQLWETPQPPAPTGQHRPQWWFGLQDSSCFFPTQSLCSKIPKDLPGIQPVKKNIAHMQYLAFLNKWASLLIHIIMGGRGEWFRKPECCKWFFKCSVSCLNQMKDPVLIVCLGHSTYAQPSPLAAGSPEIPAPASLSALQVEGGSPQLDMTCLPATMQQGSLPEKAAWGTNTAHTVTSRDLRGGSAWWIKRYLALWYYIKLQSSAEKWPFALLTRLASGVKKYRHKTFHSTSSGYRLSEIIGLKKPSWVINPLW